MTKAVAKQADQAAAIYNDDDFGNDGLEQAGAEAYAIPFLSILQKISPQCDETDAKFIPEAKGGMFYNSLTGKLYDGKTGITFLHCQYENRFIRWGARGSEGAGFKGEIMPEEIERMKADGVLVEQDGKWFFPLEDGSINEKKCDRVADVRNHYGVVLEDLTQVLLTLGSTQIKKSRQMITMLSQRKLRHPKTGQMVGPKTWLTKVKLTTVPESNDKGSWYGLKVEISGEEDGWQHDPEVKELCKAFHAAVSGGATKATYEAETADGKF